MNAIGVFAILVAMHANHDRTAATCRLAAAAMRSAAEVTGSIVLAGTRARRAALPAGRRGGARGVAVRGGQPHAVSVRYSINPLYIW